MQHFFISVFTLTLSQFYFAQCPSSLLPTTLPFVDDFENYSDTLSNNDTLICTPSFHWTFNASHMNGRALCGVGSPVNNGGNGGITFDVNGFNTFSHNELILTLNLSNYTNSSPIYLSFDCNNVADEPNAEDRIYIRGSETDSWIEVYDWSVLPTNIWVNERENLQIANILNNNGQNFSSTFQVKFSQYDNYGYSSDGFAIDNIEIAEVICNKPQNLVATYQSLDTVILNWNAVSGVNWNIQYGLKGFDLGQGTIISTSNSSDTITQLLPNSIYEVYLQKDCGLGLFSSWTAPLTIYTSITNDSSCNAIFIPADGNTIHTHNKNTGIQFAENFLLGNSPNNTIWFKTIVPNSGHLAIETCQSNFNTELGAYSITNCSDLTTFTPIGTASFSTPSTQNICNAPGKAALELCNLTPNDTVYFWIGSYTPSIEGEIIFSVIDYSLANTSGSTILDSLNYCITDTLNLFSNLQNHSSTGEWIYNENSNAIFQDSLLLPGNMTYNHNTVHYVNSNTCDADTASFHVIISEMNYAGTPIENLDFCNSSTVYLHSTLEGLIQTNGIWYNNLNTPVANNSVYFPNTIYGQQTYTYIVNDNICPADTATVNFNILDCTSISELTTDNVTISTTARKNINITSNVTCTIQVYDILGKPVSAPLSINENESINIPLTNHPNGIYLLHIKTAKEQRIKKISIG